MKGQSECDKSSTLERDYHFWVTVKEVFLLFSIARIRYMRNNKIKMKYIKKKIKEIKKEKNKEIKKEKNKKI